MIWNGGSKRRIFKKQLSQQRAFFSNPKRTPGAIHAPRRRDIGVSSDFQRLGNPKQSGPEKVTSKSPAGRSAEVNSVDGLLFPEYLPTTQ
jgi:hypothetical protein